MVSAIAAQAALDSGEFQHCACKGHARCLVLRMVHDDQTESRNSAGFRSSNNW